MKKKWRLKYLTAKKQRRKFLVLYDMELRIFFLSYWMRCVASGSLDINQRARAGRDRRGGGGLP